MALTGKRADPLIKKGPYHSKVDYNSYHSVENGHEAWFVVAPDLTNDEDHRPVYKSLFSRRRIREYEKSLGYHLSQANTNPDWWDEATKKAAEWIVTHRQVAGLVSIAISRQYAIYSDISTRIQAMICKGRYPYGLLSLSMNFAMDWRRMKRGEGTIHNAVP